MTPTLERNFSSAEVSKITGCSFRQLQWWDEGGLVRPVHTGEHQSWRRAWRSADVLQVSIIAEMRKKAVPLARLRGLKPSGDFLLIGTHRGVRHWENSRESAIQRMAQTRCACYLVDIGALRTKLESRITSLESMNR